MPTRWLIIVVVLVAAAGALGVAVWNLHRYDIRDHPLARPICVASVDDGRLRLADGRQLQVAGVTFPLPGPKRDAAMDFLRIAVKQGIEIRTDLGDGSAMLMCEPRFYNWCGTGRVGGWYVPCGLNELLVAAGYAAIDPDARVPEKEAERLRVAARIGEEHATGETPTRFFHAGIRCAGGERDVARIDELVEIDFYAKRP